MLPLGGDWPLLDGLHADAERHRERLSEWWVENPPRGTVHAPVVIAGSYRTGTTFLHRLLAESMPEKRTLLGWEATVPTPPPGPSLKERLSDPRCAEQKVLTDAVFDADPIMRDLHEEPADQPAECVQALAQTGYTGLWPAVAACPEYVDWLLSPEAQASSVAAYVYYDACLRTLNPYAGWLLKAPTHSLFVESLLTVWPSARIIRVRRDPAAAEFSAIRFFSHLRSLSQPGKLEAHEKEVASWVGDYLAEHDLRIDALEARGGPVLTIEASKLRNRPLEVVTEVRKFLKEH